MTYCCGILVRDGLVMIADTRTNAGVDNINQFRKLQLFEKPDTAIALATSGNLSVTQSVVSLLTDGFENPETGKIETLLDAETMFKAAQMVGNALREVERRELVGGSACPVELRRLSHGALLRLFERLRSRGIVDVDRLPIGDDPLTVDEDVAHRAVRGDVEQTPDGLAHRPHGRMFDVDQHQVRLGTDLEAAELLTLHAAWKLEHARMTDQDVAMAKLYASEMLGRVTDHAVQIFGGMGLMSELPIERFWRDARVDRIWDGTSEIQRHIISRALLRPHGA